VLDEDMRRVVETQRLGFVATVGPDGTPNLSPKGTTAVWDGNHLVFADLHSPQTVANIEAGHDVVEINVVDFIVRKGYRFKGTATVHRDGELFDDLVRFYERRSGLAPDRVHSIVVVEVTQAAPLISPAYDDGSSEDEVAVRTLERFGLTRVPKPPADAYPAD
jgi:predicted pyridoxine 5'-phosphate oxidase superfamily flavin-nucleotide-binding protein